MTVARYFREAGAAAWIGGQLFAVMALPRAAAAVPRWRDRRRVMAAGWSAWSPIALGAMGLATIGSAIELHSAVTPSEKQRAKLRLGSAVLGLASTSAATALGVAAKRHRAKEGNSMQRDASGYPIALSRPGLLETGMIPLNVLHALGAAGLVLADA